MKLPKLFKQKRMRGKSKSPEQKLKEQRAKLDSFLLENWLKQLRQNPELAQQIAQQRFGQEGIMPQYDADDIGGGGDLLETLRTAREARELLRDELGESKGSWMRDFAELIKAMPSALAALSQVNPAAYSQNPQLAQRQFHQINERAPQPPQPPNINEVKLDRLMPLLELSPEEALQTLQDEGEAGWLDYLATNSYEQLEQTLKAIGETNAEFKPYIEDFLKQKHRWLEELVELAHKNKQNLA